MLAFMTRQSLLRAWGEFQQEHPLIVAPIFTGVPFEAGKAYTTADEARTRNWPSDASAALIATAVWEALCGSTPIITTAMTGISFRDPRSSATCRGMLTVAVRPKRTPGPLGGEHQPSRAPRHWRCVAIVRPAADVVLVPAHCWGSLRC